MPLLTVTHEAPLELIRQNPELAAEIWQAMTGSPMPADPDIRPGPTSLNAVVPVEFTADSVVVIHDRSTGAPAVVIVIEPQGRDDRTKEYAWPAYLANVRGATRCKSAVLIVVCPDPREADKCRQVIRMGHPGWDLHPIVISPGHAPSGESASPYMHLFLTCLTPLDMETEAGARRVLAAIRDTGASDADRKKLTTIIMKRASDAARQILEDLMATAEWKDDFIESYVNIGVEQGRVEGLITAKADDILQVLEARQIASTPQQRERVTKSTDLTELKRWFGRSLTAATVDEIFAD
jgi:hypothetical protein